MLQDNRRTKMAVTVGGHDADDWDKDVKSVVCVVESGKGTNEGGRGGGE
ncbi:hypothetical protein HanPI659440_Chr00c24g0735951 [Helianthus annuus]|nr:hypothetical protein HanOQP8_Chr15g0555231 [Helianthus annuus]KAJ0815954.1 hypothetical protein HanPI659440_Chr00c24g0735951 [Helianthus annuus]